MVDLACAATPPEEALADGDGDGLVDVGKAPMLVLEGEKLEDLCRVTVDFFYANTLTIRVLRDGGGV